MPKELLEIVSFNAGTILSPDIVDIPVEAASYSLNIDSVTEDGKLKGVPEDISLILSSESIGDNPATTLSPISGGMNYILIDGKKHIVINTTSGWVVVGMIGVS